jgi:hypothetical protein
MSLSRSLKATMATKMTWDTWERCDNVHRMLTFLGNVQPHPSDRKLRLFAAACCRRLWNSLSESHRQAVEVIEKYADGGADDVVREATWQAVAGAWTLTANDAERCARNAVGSGLRVHAMLAADSAAAQAAGFRGGVSLAETNSQCGLLRDIFRNPFEPAIDIEPNLAVRRLAAGIYHERAFDGLPILADAVEEAGVSNPAILAHLRLRGAHVRGCWALDLALGWR